MTAIASPERPGVPSFVSIVNPLIRRALRIGLPFGPNVLMTVRGRTSGLPRTVPVAMIEAGGRVYVAAPFGEVQWVRNLRAAREAGIRHGRTAFRARARELTPVEAGTVLREALAPFLRSRFLAPILGRWYRLTAGSTPEDFAREAHDHPVFELERIDDTDDAAERIA